MAPVPVTAKIGSDVPTIEIAPGRVVRRSMRGGRRTMRNTMSAIANSAQASCVSSPRIASTNGMAIPSVIASRILERRHSANRSSSFR